MDKESFSRSPKKVVPQGTPPAPILFFDPQIKRWAFVAGYAYLCLLVCNIVMYEWGNRFPLPQEIKDLMTSWGALDYASDHRYRSWLKGFVMEPQKPWVYEFTGDVSQALSISPTEPAQTYSLPVDGFGFVNRHEISNADVLFVGDSFARSVGCRYEETIPALYEQMTGQKTYNASFPGYGLPHYLRIVSRLTWETQDSHERFRGKRVVVLVYVGNDLGSNIDDFLIRADRDARWPIYQHLRLETIGGFARLVLLKLKRNLRGEADTKPAVTETPTTADRARTKGYYPVYLTLPYLKGKPFAFHPGMSFDRQRDWKDVTRQRYIADLIKQFKGLSEKTGVQVLFILLPTKIQVLRPYIQAPPKSDGESLEFYQTHSASAKNFDGLTGFLEKEIRDAGLEVLNAKPLLQKRMAQEQLFWAMDTHLTPSGNKVIASLIRTHFQEKSGPGTGP